MPILFPIGWQSYTGLVIPNTLTFKFNVTDCSQTKDIDFFRYVKKPIHSVRHEDVIPYDSVNVAYVGTPEIDPDSNLILVDRSGQFFENAGQLGMDYVKFRTEIGSTYIAQYRDFLLTNKVSAGSLNTQEENPLFYKHVLSSSADVSSVKIADKDGNEANEYLYLVEAATYDGSTLAVHVYNNFENSFDDDVEKVDLYYVQYTDTGESYSELLNNEPTFKEMSGREAGDLANTSIELSSGIGAASFGEATFTYPHFLYYLISANGRYIVNMPSPGTYYIKYTSAGNIRLLPPAVLDDEKPWFASVTNGSFQRDVSDETYSYSVREFENQNFNPVRPYKYVEDELVYFVTPSVFKVLHTDLQVDTDSYKIHVVAEDQDGTPKFAATNDSGLDGTYYADRDGVTHLVKWDTDDYIGVDARNGFVHIKPRIPDTYKVYVSYYYEEKHYELASIDLNPTDGQVTFDRCVFYLVPVSSSNNNTGQETSIQYLFVNTDGVITYCSQDSSGWNEDIRGDIVAGRPFGASWGFPKPPGCLPFAFSVNGRGLHYDKVASLTLTSLSSGATSIDMTSGSISLILSLRTFPDYGTVTVSDGVNSEDFVYKGKTLTSLVGITGQSLSRSYSSPTVTLKNFVDTYTVSTYQYLILGEASITSNVKLSDAAVLDTRTHGGGIKEEYLQAAKEKQPEVVWMLGKRMHPGSASCCIKVPRTVLSDYGGTLTKKQVEEIAKEYLACGVYPVVRYYGVIPYITLISPGLDYIEIQWASEGTGYAYNVYYSTIKEGPYTQHNPSLIADVSTGNGYMMTGLSSNVDYYFYIEIVDL